MSAATHPTCKGVFNNKKPCTFKAKLGCNGFCRVHYNQANKNTEKLLNEATEQLQNLDVSSKTDTLVKENERLKKELHDLHQHIDSYYEEMPGLYDHKEILKGEWEYTEVNGKWGWGPCDSCDESSDEED